MSHQLSLPSPTRSQPIPLRAELEADAIVKWLKVLPVGNPVEAAHCVAERLQALNRAQIGSEFRLELAELYQPATQKVLEQLELGLGQVSLPLTARMRAASKAGQELLQQQAYAYKLVLQAALERHPSLVHPSLMRAMQSLARMLVLAYKVYAPARAGIWLQMHRLYQLAVEQGCATLELGGDTPVQTYKHALLISFAQPSKLAHGDVERVRQYLARHGELAILLPLATRFEGEGRFLIQPGEDQPGRALNGLHQPRAQQGDHLLSSIKLADRLLEQLAQLKGGAAPADLGLPSADAAFADLMQRLIRHWGSVPKRQFTRLRTHARVEICVGLRGIWQFLKAGSEISDSLDFSAKSEKAAPSEWMVTNEGAGGFALMHVSGAVQAVHVGEVVGLRSRDRDAWHICVVRWAMSDNPEHLEMGLQVVAPDATPASIMLPDANTTGPALMLAGIPALKQAPAILAGPGHFKKERQLLIGRERSELAVRATHLIEQTLSVELFQFSPV